MAEIEIQKVLDRFQGEIGTMHGQLLMNGLQLEAQQEELNEIKQSCEVRIRALRGLLDQNDIDWTDLATEQAAASEALDTESAEALARRIAEPASKGSKAPRTPGS